MPFSNIPNLAETSLPLLYSLLLVAMAFANECDARTTICCCWLSGEDDFEVISASTSEKDAPCLRLMPVLAIREESGNHFIR